MCLCGDTYCWSCGPAQGNAHCEVCGSWSEDGGCENPAECDAKAREMDKLYAEQELEAERLAKDYHWIP